MFNNYPFTDFSQINLDWLMSEINFLRDSSTSFEDIVKGIQNDLADWKTNIDDRVRAYFSAMSDYELEDIVSGALGQKVMITFCSSGNYEEYQKQLSGCCILSNDLGHAVLIDCGSETSAASVMAELTRLRIHTIDAIIISHWHSDHCSGLEGIVNQTAINTSETVLYAPHGLLNTSNVIGYDAAGSNWAGYMAAQERFSGIFNNKGGTVFPGEGGGFWWGGVRLDFYNLSADKLEDYYSYTADEFGQNTGITNYNNFSMLVDVRYTETRFVYTADIEKPACKNNYHIIAGAEMITVNHHGLNAIEDDSWLAAASPSYSVNMAWGAGNQRSLRDKKPMNARCSGVGCLLTTAENRVEFEYSPFGLRLVSGDTYGTNADNPVYVGEQILAGDDLEDFIKPGIYTCQNAGIASQVSNGPWTNTGYKLMVMAGTNGQARHMMAFSMNTNIPIIAIKNISAELVDYGWRYAMFAPEVVRTLLSNVSMHSNILLDTDEAGVCNRFEVRNGVVSAALKMAVSASVEASSTLFTIPCDASVPMTIFSICDSTGTSYPCRLKKVGSNAIIENLVELSPGRKLYGSVCTMSL